jgi:hypothetical protein
MHVTTTKAKRVVTGLQAKQSQKDGRKEKKDRDGQVERSRAETVGVDIQLGV